MLLVLTSYIYGQTSVVNVQHSIVLLRDMIINVGAGISFTWIDTH